MVSLQTLLSLIACFSLVTFVVLFGHIPVLKHTVVGKAKTLLTQSLPDWLRRLDETLTQGRMTPAVLRQFQSIVNERHPIVLYFYLALYLGGVAIFFSRVVPQLSWRHHASLPALVAGPLLSLYKAAATDPGVVHADNHAQLMQRYPYDHVLYRPGQECRTCLRPKIARSKHCPICNVCIAKHDHHCVWINGCVGEQNMRFFLAFLVCNILTFSYATVTMIGIMRIAMRTSPSLALLAVLRLDPWIGSLAVFAAVCDALVSAFLCYHLYLIWSGVTTNETLKFADIGEALDGGDIVLVVHGKQPKLVTADDARRLSGRPMTLRALDNRYDEGWLSNLMGVLSPARAL